MSSFLRNDCTLIILNEFSFKVHTNYQSQSIRLIRLRNPWGNDREWSGPWSDQSREWRNIPPDERKRIGLTFDEDGEFW